MRYFIGWMLAVLCAAVGVASRPAWAERRLALAVGIDAYDNLPAIAQLQKAANDAEAVGAALTELGFDTQVERNLTRLELTRAWQAFLNKLEPGDTAAFFFAGHGVEVAGLNYLLPRDVPKVGQREDHVLAEASIRFNALMENLRDKKVRVALFIVDACRDNPFRDGSGRSVVGGTRGLTRVEPSSGTFVMYAAGAGEQALDRLPGGADMSANSVYTRALLPILKTPGLSLQEVALRVREEVVALARAAGHEQTPAYYDQVVGRLVLKAAPKGSDPAGPTPGQTGAAADTVRICREVESMSNSATLAVLERQYKGTSASECVTARLRQIALAAPNPVEPPPIFNAARKAMPLTAAEEHGLKPKDSFKECDVCPEMVVVPAGSFMMGAPPGEEGGYDTEGPQHLVQIARPFAVGKFEVTFAEWDACAREGGCIYRPEERWGGGKQPVILVSWHVINAQYLTWLSRKTGKAYRLLTEAEWEHAARAGTMTRYAFGETITASQAQFVPTGKTTPVGSFQPNAFGLYDMHGNVWEWVHDCWNKSYDGAPSNGSAWTAGNCNSRVIRGGSWSDSPRKLRAAMRDWYNVDSQGPNGGFRVGRTL